MSNPPTVAVLGGDGIGPEVTRVAVRLAQAAGMRARWQEHPVGWDLWLKEGEALPGSTLEACRAADAVLFGAITSKPEREAQRELAPELRGRCRYVSPILRLRRELGLRVAVRPVRGGPLDATIVRENSEGLYAGHEARPVPEGLRQWFPGLPVGEDAAVALRVVTRNAVEHACRTAFRCARETGRQRVTLVEKPNVLRTTGGFVREIFHEVAAAFPDVEADELNVDAACALLVREPTRFQLVVATNLFGDILSDLAAELAGGLSLCASANLGEHHALFEPVHGSAPDIAGKGTANPVAAIRAVTMLAQHVGQKDAAQALTHAVDRVLREPALRTPDQGGTATTVDVEQALVKALDARVRLDPVA